MNQLDNFLEADKPRAKRELDCIEYLREQEFEASMNGQYERASYLARNIVRSYTELHILSKKKLQREEKTKLVLANYQVPPQILVDEHIRRYRQ
ncbi:hypothetical protein [Paraliobacillus ryukyuensis]|uniref:hypothetical protein n=1 Tax=Paraliobacillus ryukyuensis TaxID=200904 RepID=UPI0009A6402F|nr:hypothetical protein [Paraliobacillus ryukyuensis]